ncbi:MAG: DUF4912 domain-containing protein [Treponema sp.]|jgi:hypothetical protein|nr:DUF4912 domain-containing protein [Treponema sp.]
MEDFLSNPVTRASLESLSTGELIKAADSFGIDIPAGLERVFIIEEILEYASEQADLSAKKISNNELIVNPVYSETSPLPKQYNITFIEVIIRDPLWVFVFWEIKEHDKETYKNMPDFKGYCLRVISANQGETEQQSLDNSFTVAVGPQDNARYLGFAERTTDTSNYSGRYVIRLSALCGDSELHIATSQSFNLPKLYENGIISDMSSNKLIYLSGIEDLSIIKKTDRQSRGKRL